MADISEVTHSKMSGSPSEIRGIETYTATRTFKVAWDDRTEFMNDALEANNGFGHSYPDNEFAKAITCQANPIGVELGTSDPNATYNHAVIVVNYAIPTSDASRPESPNSSVAISESFEPWVENLELGHEGYRWGGGSGVPLTAAQAIVKPVYGVDYVFTRHRLLQMPTRPFRSIGRVNQSSMVTFFSGIPFSAEQILFKGFTVQNTVRLGVGNTYRATYRFGAREHGWNRFWLPNTGAPNGGSWEFIYVAESSTPHRNFPLGSLDF